MTEMLERAADSIAAVMEAVLPPLGWLDDIVQLRVYFDSNVAGAPSPVVGGLVDGEEADTEQPAAVFAAGAPIRGFVRIIAPPGTRVVHNGVRAVLHAALVTTDERASRALFELPRQLISPGAVEGTVDVPFDFPGALTTPLPESYEGTLFSLRSRLAVTVARPWWTFEVTRDAPLLVQRLYEAPARASYAVELSSAGELTTAVAEADEAAAVSAPMPTAAGSKVASQLAVYSPQTAVLAGHDGCSVKLRLESGRYELCDKLAGELHFSGVVVPIVLVRLALLKVEYNNGATEDEVIFDETLLDARRWRARQREACIRAGQTPPTPAEDGEVGAELTDDDGDSGDDRPSAQDVDGNDDDDDDDFSPRRAAVERQQQQGHRRRRRRNPASDPSAWVPSPDELNALAAGETVDPDLPVVGDVAMTIALDFSQIAGVQPSISIMLPPSLRAGESPADASPLPEGVLRPAADAAPLLSTSRPDLREDASVRYFLRLSVYDAFSARRKRWMCREIILFRESLYGHALPPPPPPPRALRRAESDVSSVGGDAGGATSPKLGPSTPTTRSRASSMAKLGSTGGSGRALSATNSFTLGATVATPSRLSSPSTSARNLGIGSNTPSPVADLRAVPSGDGEDDSEEEARAYEEDV